MCWSMWTEYRYCSPMSWIGQSLASPQQRHRADEAAHVAPRDDRLARRHGVRADALDHVDVRADQEDDEHPDVRVGHEPEGVHDGLTEHATSLLPRRRSRIKAGPVCPERPDPVRHVLGRRGERSTHRRRVESRRRAGRPVTTAGAMPPRTPSAEIAAQVARGDAGSGRPRPTDAEHVTRVGPGRSGRRRQLAEEVERRQGDDVHEDRQDAGPCRTGS